MSNVTINVTAEYEEAIDAAELFNPGALPDIAQLMKSAFVHGYAQALIDQRYPEDADPSTFRDSTSNNEQPKE